MDLLSATDCLFVDWTGHLLLRITMLFTVFIEVFHFEGFLFFPIGLKVTHTYNSHFDAITGWYCR